MRAREGRTFTENGRRAQIVQAAIEVIAEQGYAKASFAEIARHAGLSSKGLISYHFASKEDLVRQIVEQVYTQIVATVGELMAAEDTAAGALRAYIEGNVRFAWTHRTQMKALLDVFVHGGLDYDAEDDANAMSPVEEVLHRGQRDGEFREFDVRVMATTLQRAIEGPTFLLESHPALDLAGYERELCTMFELATRREPGS